MANDTEAFERIITGKTVGYTEDMVIDHPEYGEIKLLHEVDWTSDDAIPIAWDAHLTSELADEERSTYTMVDVRLAATWHPSDDSVTWEKVDQNPEYVLDAYGACQAAQTAATTIINELVLELDTIYDITAAVPEAAATMKTVLECMATGDFEKVRTIPTSEILESRGKVIDYVLGVQTASIRDLTGNYHLVKPTVVKLMVEMVEMLRQWDMRGK